MLIHSGYIGKRSPDIICIHGLWYNDCIPELPAETVGLILSLKGVYFVTQLAVTAIWVKAGIYFSISEGLSDFFTP